MSNTVNNYTETDLGNISLNPRGEYDNSAAYEYLDTVSYRGGSYFCRAELETTITGIAPDAGHDSEHWQMIAAPGDMTPEYTAAHNDVIKKAVQVETSRAAVELAQQEIEAVQTDVQQLHSDTVQATQEAENSKNSAANSAQSAEQSRKTVSESEQNINEQIAGFDSRVSEAVEQSKEEINTTKQQAINTITNQQNTSVNTVKTEGEKIITRVENDAKTVADDRATVEEAAQTVLNNAQEVAQNAQTVASNTENAAASAESAKTSADNAVRSAKSVEDASKQIEQNKKDVASLKEDLGNLLRGLTVNDFVEGYYTNNGDFNVESTNNSYTTRIIRNNLIKNGNIVIDDLYGVNIAYFLDGVFHHRDTWKYGNTVELIKENYDVAIMIATYNSNQKYSIEQMIEHYSFRQVLPDLANVESDLANVESDLYGTKFNVTYTNGNISSSGVVSDKPTDNGNCKSSLIPSECFDYIDIVTDDSKYLSGYCKYKNGAFVSRIAWNETHRIENDGHDIVILFSSKTSGKTKDDVLFECSIDVVKNTIISRVERLEKIDMSKQVAFMNIVVCSDTGRNIIHFSVDDTWICINDLITNANINTSIFENSFLNGLKTLHDRYGICITLNTFNRYSETPSYNIYNVPTKFQSEFQSCKSWLKFAFHAESNIENYNTSSGISESYDIFVNAIYQLTGDYDCIDRFTRLGFFGGSIENVLAIKNKEHGITGLLCADTTNRDSYYLNVEQNKIVQTKGKYIDAENELFMIKTITRELENAVSEIQDNLCYQKYVEIFMHEYEGLPTFSNVAKWASENGYVNAFPSLLVN